MNQDQETVKLVARLLPILSMNSLIPIFVIGKILFYQDLGNKCIGMIDINTIANAKPGVLEVGGVPLHVLSNNQEEYSQCPETTRVKATDIMIAEGYAQLCYRHDLEPVQLLQDLVDRQELTSQISKN